MKVYEVFDQLYARKDREGSVCEFKFVGTVKAADEETALKQAKQMCIIPMVELRIERQTTQLTRHR